MNEFLEALTRFGVEIHNPLAWPLNYAETLPGYQNLIHGIKYLTSMKGSINGLSTRPPGMLNIPQRSCIL